MSKYPSTFDAKRKEIQLIKIAQRQLNMDDATYRAMLWTVARVNSSTALDWAGRKKVLDHLKAKGFKTKHRGRKLADDDQSRKIRALWLDLHAAGGVKNASEQALVAYVKRITTRDALEWLNTKEASRVIETMKKWLQRVTTKVDDVG